MTYSHNQERKARKREGYRIPLKTLTPLVRNGETTTVKKKDGN